MRSTQATQRATGDDGITGDSNAEWRWGPRAFKEFGEDGVTLFIRDFYRSYQKGRPNESNAKDSKELMQEILKGATGNKPETRLIPARDDTE